MPPHGKKRANYLHGSQPVRSRRNPVTKLGKPAVSQHSPMRHYVLATIGPKTFFAEGKYFNGSFYDDTVTFKWLEANRLTEKLPPARPGGPQQIERTERGDQVLATWDEQHGPIETEEC